MKRVVYYQNNKGFMKRFRNFLKFFVMKFYSDRHLFRTVYLKNC